MSRVLLKPDQLSMAKAPRVHNKPHLDFIRALPCVICLNDQATQACHVRLNDSRYLKVTGGGEKPADKWVIPMCERHHSEQTHMGEGPRFWEHYGFDPHALALMLHDVSPEIPTGRRVIGNWNLRIV